MKNIPLRKTNIRPVGRTEWIDDTLWFALSGTGIAFTYSGKHLSVTIVGGNAAVTPNNQENYPRFAIYVNDVRVIDEILTCPEKTYEVPLTKAGCAEDKFPGAVSADTLTDNSCTVQIVKLSECAMSVLGIKELTIDEEATLAPTPKRPHKIEIIGDSITCGYGIDDENCEHHFSCSTEDVTRAYAYKTAKALNADYSLFSISGYGIISGYTDNPEIQHPEQQLPLFYESLGFSYDVFNGDVKPDSILWDFQKFIPDIVVINLGTNDDSFCQDMPERQAEYETSYVAFLKTVRKRNPQAKILCILGLMGSRLFSHIQTACAAYTAETGDTNIDTLLLPEQDGNVGYVADYHPLEVFHNQAKDVLVEKIRAIMRW